MFELQKVVAALLMPVGTSMLLAILALVAALLKRRRVAIAGAALSIGWILIWSTPAVSRSVRLFLEMQAPAKPVSELPSADVIVVLSGGIAGAVPPWRPYPDMGSAADRVWHAARLYHAGKAPRLLLSGGQVFKSAAGDEADAMAALLKDLGVPAGAMIFERNSRNTSQNASESTKIMASSGFHRALLVTSALHMPRALLSFEKGGFEVVPASTDVELIPDADHWPGALLPNAVALEGSERALHELVGIAYCRLFGC